VVAYDISAGDPAGARATIESLRGIVEREAHSDLDETTPQSDKNQPSAETGELGFTDGYERYGLSVVIGFGSAAFDKLGIAADERPQDLIPIPWEKLSDQPAVAGNGDIMVQVCSNSSFINEHVLRRIGQELAGQLTQVWAVNGLQRHNSRAGRPSRDEGRALIGFLDGTSNLDPRHNPQDAELVFVDPDKVGDYPPAQPPVEPGQPNPYGGSQPPVFPPDLRTPPPAEPEWTRGGTYAVVRASTFDPAAWDQRALGDQEKTVGRWKVSGQPLDHADDPTAQMAEPNFATDPDGATTPLASHVRKANPRGGADDLKRRIFRRGYPLISDSPQLGSQRGLVFICFGRTIAAQFEFITRAWTANPDFPRPGTGQDALRAIEAVLCGGYFFVPPLRNANKPWSWVLPEATTTPAAGEVVA